MHRKTHLVASAVAFVLTVVPTASSCSAHEEEEIDGYVYCVNKDTGEIVDDDYCDSNPAGYWFWTSTTHHSHGHHVLSKYHGSFVNPRSPEDRAKAGIPKTGKVSSGQKIKSGGFGNGVKAGAGSRSGSGGG